MHLFSFNLRFLKSIGLIYVSFASLVFLTIMYTHHALHVLDVPGH